MIKPPVRDATAMVWGSRGRLIVGTAHGTGHIVHPALGTGTLWTDRAPVLGLGVRGRDIAVVEADGSWRMLDIDGHEAYCATHPFVGPVTVQFDADCVLLTGPTRAERRTLFYDRGKKIFRIRLPERCVALIDENSDLALAQSTPHGLEVLRVAPGARFQHAQSSEHMLDVVRGGVVGVSEAGVRVWRSGSWEATDVAVTDASIATTSGDGRYLAVGTHHGGVAMVDLDAPEQVAEPATISVSSAPVRSLAFSERGGWLASGADVLAVWSWEAGGR